MAAMIGLASPASAKPKDKKKVGKEQATRTWKNVIDYVMVNGSDRKLLAPTTKLLGYNSDEVLTKALRYKSDDSPDKMSHAIYVISEVQDGKSAPREIILGNRISVTKNGVKSINDFLVRTDLNGRIISAATSKGPSGHVVESILPPDSDEAIIGHKAEQKIHLQTMDLRKLTQ